MVVLSLTAIFISQTCLYFLWVLDSYCPCLYFILLASDYLSNLWRSFPILTASPKALASTLNSVSSMNLMSMPLCLLVLDNNLNKKWIQSRALWSTIFMCLLVKINVCVFNKVQFWKYMLFSSESGIIQVEFVTVLAIQGCSSEQIKLNNFIAQKCNTLSFKIKSH